LGSGVRLSEFESWISCVLLILIGQLFHSLGLNFLIRKMEKIMVPISQQIQVLPTEKLFSFETHGQCSGLLQLRIQVSPDRERDLV
jgi:hypothetical protein